MGRPGRIQYRPIPSWSKWASPSPPNRQTERMSLCIHGASRALTTNQPPVCGTPSSSLASGTVGTSAHEAHDLGQRLELGEVPVHRRQRELLRAGGDERAKRLGDPLRRSADRDALAQPARPVHAVDDRAEALSRDRLVVLDRDVDALGDGEPGRIAALLLERAADDPGLGGEVLDRRRAGADPAVAQAGRTPQRRLAAGAEPDRPARAPAGPRP